MYQKKSTLLSSNVDNKLLLPDFATRRNNASSAFASPLRYPGGKGRLGPWIASLIRANGLCGGCYVEPYAGGAGAAMYLLLHNHVNHIIINDADPAVYSFWQAVVNDHEALIEEIKTREPTMETRDFAKKVLSNINAHSIVETAFSAFFLNRTSWSGILNGGVIGGTAQGGKIKLDARYNRTDLIARIRVIAAERSRIRVYGLDAIKFLGSNGVELPNKTLIYLDPPYYNKGSQLYRRFYEHKDHADLARIATTLTRPTIISYDDTPEIREMYREMKSTSISLRYSTHAKRPITSEIMFYAGLTLPNPLLLPAPAP